MSAEFSILSKKPVEELLIGKIETKAAERAFADFLKLPGFTFESDAAQIAANNIVGEFIHLRSLNSPSNNPFFNSMFAKLDIGNQHKIIEYGEKRRILMLRREKPSPKMIDAILAHANRFHHSAVSFTEVQLAAQNARHETQTNPNADEKILTEEDISLNRILSLTGNAIKFYPLNQKSEIASIFEQLNSISDKYETDYAIYQAVRTITDARNKLAALGIPAGIVIERLLEHLPSDFLAQIVSQTAGEATAMFVAAAPKLAACFQRKKESETAHSMDPQQQRKRLLRGAIRSAVLAGTVGATCALSALSQETHSLLPYAFIPGLNTTVITMFEAMERSIDYNQIPLTNIQLEELQSQLPKILQLALRAAPQAYKNGTAIALIDMRKDPYTWGTLYGSLISSCITMPLESMGVPRDWIFALTGMIIENTVSVSYGLSKKRDPYKEFKDRFK